MPNLRGKTWTTTTPANVEDAQYWEDHLISDEDAAKIGTVILPEGGTVGQVLTKQSSSPNDADWDDPASSGHTIQDEDGTDMPYQQTLQFVNAEVSNDSVNDRTVVDCKGAKGDAATITVGTVSTLPAGSSATVVNSGTTKDAVFDFGIPEGADGTDGTDGEDGFSPTVTITTIPGGHQVNITDAEHPQGQTFNVMDGSGSGDMQASAYDPNSDVYNAGGIPDYVDDEIATAISGKADKVLNATNGNFAGLDVNGNLTDSGKKASDFLPSNTPIPDEVTANPQGTATGTLTKLGIGNDIYDIPSGGGSSTLEDLTDVNISSPSDGQILQYDAASQKWVNHVNAPEYITVNVDVYSAASDTLTYTDATGQKTVTTDASGHGTATIVCTMGDSVTFTSSVAKNPSDLSQAYSKAITITAATTDIFVMPSGCIYWYGYKSSNFAECTDANGWVYQTGQSYTSDTPSYSTNYVTFNAGDRKYIGITCTSPLSNISTVYAIAQGVTLVSGYYGLFGGSTNKIIRDVTSDAESITSASITKLSRDVSSLSGAIYPFIEAQWGRNLKVYALWYE